MPGGQASYSAIVENYPGFPEGLSGSDLARRTVEQAGSGSALRSWSPVAPQRASGRTAATMPSRWTRVPICSRRQWWSASARTSARSMPPGVPNWSVPGIDYGAATAEASACRDQDIYILGGGNSAGQAALLLSRYARRLFIVAPERSLEETMSQYLVNRIRRLPNVVVLTCHTVVAAEGGEKFLQRLVLLEPRHRRDQAGGGGGPLRFHRRQPAHRVAGRYARSRRPGVHSHRLLFAPGRESPQADVAPRPAAVSPGDQPPWCVCRRGRALRLGQADRGGRRGGRRWPCSSCTDIAS